MAGRPRKPKTDLAKSLISLRERSGLGAQHVASACGVSVAALANYERGDNVPDADFIREFIRVTGADPWELLSVDRAPEQAHTRPIALHERPAGFVTVPQLDIRAAAGAGALVPGFAEQDEFFAQAEIIAFREDWLRQLGVAARFARILICDGDSMHPTIEHGDMMLVDTAIREVAQDGIYVLVYAGLLKVKRIQLRRDGILLLKSDNSAYETEEVPMHEQPELIIEGRVRWVGGAI